MLFLLFEEFWSYYLCASIGIFFRCGIRADRDFSLVLYSSVTELQEKSIDSSLFAVMKSISLRDRLPSMLKTYLSRLLTEGDIW